MSECTEADHDGCREKDEGKDLFFNDRLRTLLSAISNTSKSNHEVSTNTGAPSRGQHRVTVGLTLFVSFRLARLKCCRVEVRNVDNVAS